MLGGKQAWLDHAAALKVRMAPLQLHVEPDWLFCLCTSCGWSLELAPAHRSEFRYTVATHECGPEEVPEAAPVLADVLF